MKGWEESIKYKIRKEGIAREMSTKAGKIVHTSSNHTPGDLIEGSLLKVTKTVNPRTITKMALIVATANWWKFSNNVMIGESLSWNKHCPYSEISEAYHLKMTKQIPRTKLNRVFQVSLIKKS